MGILSWILLGLIVGVLAKWIMPGDDPGGTIITILLGIAGAFVGGFLATLIGLGTVDGFNVGSLLIAIGGSLLLLWVYRKMRTNRVT
ncbi:MAG TPA: GlsB/YeaQ/YmgE family stress response membrane protein [Myxococcota bacterium]|nr:GlsB/YeaQ/YmgE family stress response membrane protein [Myxococcota bacterium]